MLPCLTILAFEHGFVWPDPSATISTVPCQNLLFWALSWVTPWRTRTPWCYGKLSLVIFQMELKWYLISSWVVGRQNGSGRLALLFAFLMDMMVRGLNILVQDWSAFFRYYFAFSAEKMQSQLSCELVHSFIHFKGTIARSLAVNWFCLHRSIFSLKIIIINQRNVFLCYANVFLCHVLITKKLNT